MSPRTRRQVLHAGGASLLAALAGCSGESSSASSAGAPRETVDPDSLVTDYALLTLRRAADRPIFRKRDPDSDDDDGRNLDAFLLESEADLDAVAFVDSPPRADEARRFFAETDFEAQSLAVVQHRVDACHRVRLQYVRSTDDRAFDAQFCRVVRDASVECSVDDYDVVATLVRLPYSLSDRGGEWGYGSSSRCGPLPKPLRNRTDEEVA